jgi:hypothetical protein
MKVKGEVCTAVYTIPLTERALDMETLVVKVKQYMQ